MYQRANNSLSRFGERCDSWVCQRRCRLPQCCQRQKSRRASYLARLLLLTLTTHPILAQQKSPEPLKRINANIAAMPHDQKQTPAPAKRSITISDAVSIFLQQNLQLVAARYDIDMVDAEKLTARLRPNPQVSVTSEGLPLDFSGNVVTEQQFAYDIFQTFELGGKRRKRIDAANANSDLARAGFQMVVWQLTNDLKKKFYAVLLAESLLKLAKENQTTFEETLKHTTELFQLGEISVLDLRRLEVEKLKFDDLKAAQLSERSADASIRLQDAQRIPDVTLGTGVTQVPSGTSSYNFGIGITLPVSDRNQGERAKALIEKRKAQNEQQLIANQVLSDVDKAMVAFEIQKRRVALYRTGVLTKVNDIQNLTEFSLKAGESSTLDLLDAIRTRRETLASYYQTLFDYQVSLLDLELATATPLKK